LLIIHRQTRTYRTPPLLEVVKNQNVLQLVGSTVLEVGS
jgi:hypothetical protein